MKPENPDAESAAPLLPELRSPETQCPSGGALVSGAVFNVSTSMIGAGIMSIPATFKVLGVIPGFILIPIVALSVEITVEFLLRYTNSGKVVTYGGLMAESFGKIGSIALQVCVMVTNLGAMIIYLIIIGRLISYVSVDQTPKDHPTR
ncbi:amino acid transporter AVT6B-like [Rhododendron vialii]|uniref:amino acid transporter AVT6B-like n=1 Tax=Rhododendron vialii TaxID=182163 RepID=UPI00265DE75A|nr:amino acid transporter AVT6B-like [Rhododendron vialii]